MGGALMSTEQDGIKQLIEAVEAYVPYIRSTISENNSFACEKLKGFKGTDLHEWMAIHRGRAGSSVAQLDQLLRTATALKARLKEGI
jgi:hypothetical protein